MLQHPQRQGAFGRWWIARTATGFGRSNPASSSAATATQAYLPVFADIDDAMAMPATGSGAPMVSA